MKTHNSAYRALITIGMLVLAVLGMSLGIAGSEFILNSPFELLSIDNRSTLVKGMLIMLIGVGLILIAAVGLTDTYFDHRGG